MNGTQADSGILYFLCRVSVILTVICMCLLSSAESLMAQGASDEAKPSLEFIRVSADGSHFVLADSGRQIQMWGANYDHDEAGQLIED